MEFGPLHLAYFGATRGACSAVTDRERIDGQITVVKDEKEVLYSTIPESTIHRGPKRTNPEAAKQNFILHGCGQPVTPYLIFPKIEENELRLYIPEDSAFSPPAGNIWFLYEKNSQLYLGHMPELQWRRIGTGDVDDSKLQEAIYSGDDNPVETTTHTGSVYVRNPAISRQALADAGYQCEYDPSIGLFTARATGHPFLEAHHLIPLYATEQLGGFSLDILQNVVALSPNWHRAIHHGETRLVSQILETLVAKRPTLLDLYDIGMGDLKEIYGCSNLN